MYQRALPPHILMDVSEMRIEHIRWAGSETERQVVKRLFERPNAYLQWETYHAGLMRKLGHDASRKAQLVSMRQTRFELIHRQALFQFLRDASVTGSQREALFSALHGTKDYTRAVLAEHARYLQSNSSMICADHVAFSMMGDWRFSHQLDEYRRRYVEYFGHYCNWVLAEAQGRDAPSSRLLPQLKLELQVVHREMLALPAPRPAVRH